MCDESEQSSATPPNFEYYVDLLPAEAETRQAKVLAAMGTPPVYICAGQTYARITVKVEYGLPKKMESE